MSDLDWSYWMNYDWSEFDWSDFDWSDLSDWYDWESEWEFDVKKHHAKSAKTHPVHKAKKAHHAKKHHA